MRWLRMFIFLIFPLCIFASPLSSRYGESFVHSFQQGDFLDSLQILDEWGAFEPEQKSKITGMRAAVYLSVGQIEEGTLLMDQFIHSLSAEELSDPMMTFILQVYYKALPSSSMEQISFTGMARLCKQEQPSGVKLKYWFGVGQILVGVLAAPFSAGTSTALILSGTAMVVDAASDALNNKENWERDLNDRQRMNPDVQRNSFYSPSNFRMKLEVV
jgi:hypothetical protein